MIYVGDLAQQVRLGTIRSWGEIGENLKDDRAIKLQKVYRNTKQILNYIQNLGFDVDIPHGLKEGREVSEKIVSASDETISYIRDIATKTSQGDEMKTIGIIGKNQDDIKELKEAFVDNRNIHVCTMAESQGVEFDIVCIIAIDKELFRLVDEQSLNPEFIDEFKKIEKDLLYVALTRAMSEMHIIGSCTLKEALAGI